MTLYEITEQKLYYFRYSENTIKTYLNYIYNFEQWAKKHYSRLTSKDIQNYLDTYKFTSGSQQNQVISSLKFAWEKGLGKKYLKINFKRPRKEKKLPKVIDANFVREKLCEIENLKHKAILSLAFSCALRVSEVINLRLEDIDNKRMIINIKNAKGRKDRIVKLSYSLLKILREYYKEYIPKEYLFNGQFSLQYSSSSCNQIVKKYLGVSYHFHLLRHSSLTDMHENNVDIATLSKIAGHNSIKTTMIYTHVSNNVIQNTYSPL